MSSMGHFFTDIWFLSNHPCTRPSSWLLEKTPGCQERYWYSLRAPQNRSDAHFFLLVQIHHKIQEQFTLFKLSSSWDNCAGRPSSCEQKWYMGVSGSPRSKIFLRLGIFWMPYDLVKTLWAQDMWQMWPAHCSGWGAQFAGLFAWTSCQPSRATLPACLPTSVTQLVWGGLFWTRSVSCGLFCGQVPSPFPFIILAPCWFGYRLSPSFLSDAPQRHT